MIAFDRDSVTPPDLIEEEVKYLESSGAKLDLARFGAMLDWGAIEPADMRCPTLWLVGSENESAMENAQEYESMLSDSQVHLEVIEGLDHPGEFDAVSVVLPVMLDFIQERS